MTREQMDIEMKLMVDKMQAAGYGDAADRILLAYKYFTDAKFQEMCEELARSKF